MSRFFLLLWFVVSPVPATAATLPSFLRCIEGVVRSLPNETDGRADAATLIERAFRVHNEGRWAAASDELLRECQALSARVAEQATLSTEPVTPLIAQYFNEIRWVQRTTNTLFFGGGIAAIMGFSANATVSYCTQSDGWCWLEIGADVAVQLGIGYYVGVGARSDTPFTSGNGRPRIGFRSNGTGQEVQTTALVGGFVSRNEGRHSCPMAVAFGGALMWGFENRGGLQITPAWRIDGPLVTRFEAFATAFAATP